MSQHEICDVCGKRKAWYFDKLQSQCLSCTQDILPKLLRKYCSWDDPVVLDRKTRKDFRSKLTVEQLYVMIDRKRRSQR